MEFVFNVFNSRLWNGLPSEIRYIETRDTFQKEYSLNIQNNDNNNN